MSLSQFWIVRVERAALVGYCPNAAASVHRVAYAVRKKGVCFEWSVLQRRLRGL